MTSCRSGNRLFVIQWPLVVGVSGYGTVDVLDRERAQVGVETRSVRRQRGYPSMPTISLSQHGSSHISYHISESTT
jgi:hypothetical protein